MGVVRESRTTQRYPIKGGVAVSWQDSHGSFRAIQAQGVNISETGLEIEIPDSIDRGSNVTVRAEKLRLSAAAVVRYCRRNGPKFRLGLEFIGGLQWRPPVPGAAG